MTTKELNIELSSQISQIQRVEAFVEQICDEYNIYNNYFSNILVAVTEAFSNAVIHGNRNDASKKILLCFRSAPLGLIFSIEDQGIGFDYTQIPDPTNALSIDSKQGRGIYLIKNLSDDIQFLNHGKKVEMLFKIASINFETSLTRASLFKDYVTMSLKDAQKSNGK